ncbi:UbiX family flavin prenyltransferase [Brevibacterium sp.]|uniref:UbiX family flavin prenyltransferase n=1 Tax=Brevibacterium sp. TaxID=1701 RepID=UPI002811B3E4|nr:UbiX family flavin prenyltransferase [Brevibacterium sp.]
MSAPRRMVVGITGASGTAYGIRLLEVLADLGIESHLVMSKAAELSLVHESDLRPKDVRAKADVVHPIGNVAAGIASGSFRTMGMIVAPCSVRTLGEIATGAGSTLLSRAADVTLKERRPLVLLLRESPLNLIHIRNMETATLAGATVCLPVPSFYNHPQTVADIVDEGIGRLLDQFGIDNPLVHRWAEES